jgi:RHS repeat-associated protein
VSRTSGGQTLSFVYDAENRLMGVSGAASAGFVYDGDGRRVKGTVNGVTTYYVGDHYEVSAGVVKKYSSAGGQRIALRDGGTLYWLLTDHLGGTAYTVSGTTRTGELRYRPFGVTRFASGTTPTSVRFTGQREEAALGLYYYNARWYDPTLGHFLSPDTLVPEAGNALDYHRYAYVRFNPLKYEDESGHCATLANGEADENDAECWRLARTIANLWNDTDYWRTRFGELDVWNNHIAPSAVTTEFMQDELDRYLQSDAYKTWAAVHPMSGDDSGGAVDWGDYWSVTLQYAVIQGGFAIDDHGNGYLRIGLSFGTTGIAINRGDVIVYKEGQYVDIDQLYLSPDMESVLMQEALSGASSGISGGFVVGLSGSRGLSAPHHAMLEGGLAFPFGVAIAISPYSYTWSFPR